MEVKSTTGPSGVHNFFYYVGCFVGHYNHQAWLFMKALEMLHMSFLFITEYFSILYTKHSRHHSLLPEDYNYITALIVVFFILSFIQSFHDCLLSITASLSYLEA